MPVHFNHGNVCREVKDSPVGSGRVTAVADTGFPRVNGVAVAWLEFLDGDVFDPYGVRERHLAHRAQQAKERS